MLDAYRLYERLVRLDGVFAWYRAFVEVAGGRRRRDQVLQAARYCFTDTERFVPIAPKQPVVLFAGRLSEQKRPLLFVDAVAILRDRHPELVRGWRFQMYGRGRLAAEVASRISARGLDPLLTLSHAIDMAPIVGESRLFVSTQAFENFTSLAMLEAMAAGNAVIAEDVGQTGEFVRDGENGFLVSPPTPEAFAEAMARYLRAPDVHDAMAAASRRVATEVHTIEHFAGDIVAFWRRLAAQPQR